MFTGLDLVVILLVFFAFFYATSKPSKDKDAGFKLEPLTLLLVTVVVGMVAISLMDR
ncbi:hypothetical protein IQ273_05460 [Nodosilinea sp. LEGE 07298]|jgi:hypothetical protein|uniref:hypothetical protein n=1 Tax=Nodosilinea sp. LEGE 07298 TaxID=2777970 RepID=UPI001880502E|nr:hypothetical protein [Nodosilinea sp. LEGE 07298]MBE9108864.1 hypothetical protein [Nodosilinea sp. LEGE 07298]